MGGGRPIAFKGCAETMIYLQSFGPNGIDENGLGDDIGFVVIAPVP